MIKNLEKKLKKSFKVYLDSRKGNLTLFEKKTGLFKASIARVESFPIPQFVYDLHVENVVEYERTESGIPRPETYTRTVVETYDTFDEAVERLLRLV